MTRYTIVFDGGSRGNPGPAYGSYHIRPWTTTKGITERLEFGRGTNNEAEYLSLIAALRALHAFLAGMEQNPAAVELEIRGDSQLVMRQVAGRWKAKDARMMRLRDEAQQLAEPFRRVVYREQPRQATVKLLGH